MLIEGFIFYIRLQLPNADIVKICTSLNSPTIYQLVFVKTLYKLKTLNSLPKTWPTRNVFDGKSSELRAIFTDALNKATQGYITHTPLRMIQSFTLKSKDSQAKAKERAEDITGYKNLLLYIVRLININPDLLIDVSFFPFLSFILLIDYYV